MDKASWSPSFRASLSLTSCQTGIAWVASSTIYDQHLLSPTLSRTEVVMDRYPGRRRLQAWMAPMCRRTVLRRVGRGVSAAALLAAIGPGRSGAAQQDGPPPDWFLPDATRGFHGQVVLGGGPVYLSHLPMFMFN